MGPAPEPPTCLTTGCTVNHIDQLSVNYLITFVQRSGSNWFCEALSRTGVLGNPTEYFIPHFPDAEKHGATLAGFEESAWARERGISSFRDFLQMVLQECRTPNGVCGVKISWIALEELLRKLSGLGDHAGLPGAELLSAVFDKPKLIHLGRRDKVRQAVSWALAGQTGHWSSSQAATRPALNDPSFDIEFLDGLYRLLRESDAGWTDFFQRYQVDPLHLYYEDLVADLEGSILCVLGWLGIPVPQSFDLSNLSFQPQSTRLNEEWAERFRSLRPEIQCEPAA